MADEQDKVRNKLRELQYQIRQNANQTTDYLSDLQEWTSDMRQKDAGLLQKSTTETTTKAPIRKAPMVEEIGGSSTPEKQSGKCGHSQNNAEKKDKIKSYDYRAWDKFNVDEACDDVDFETAKVEDQEQCGSECEYQENDIPNEELELAAKKKRAELEKIRGNEFFEKGKFLEASMAYTRALGFDFKNPVYFANRAMACLKLKKFAEAERDSTSALALDPCYLKAFHRRATARLSLKKIPGAKADFLMVLKLDPSNAEAKEKLEVIEKWEEKHGQKANMSAEEKTITEGLPVVKPAVAKEKTEAELEKEVIISRRGMVEVKTVKIEQKADESSDVARKRIPLQFLPTPAIPTSTKPLRKVEIKDAAELSSSASKQSLEPRSAFPPSAQKATATTLPKEAPKVMNPERRLSVEPPTRVQSVRAPVRQLTMSWKEFSQKCCSCHKDPHACADFIQNIPPSSYAQLIGQTLEPEMFSTIINGSVELCQRGFHQEALSQLAALITVPRFGFFVHLLTDQQKQGLRECLESSRNGGKEINMDDVMSNVARKFLLNLKA